MADQDAGVLGPVPENFDPEKRYRVNIGQSVRVLGQQLNPGNVPVLDGATAQSIRAAIVGAVEVA